MTDLGRRNVLRLLGGISLGIALPISWKAGGKSEIQHELQTALNIWKKNEVISPEFFIENNNITSMSIYDLKQHIENEFKLLNTMIVNGLILSQTEVALLAFIASQ